MRIIQLPAEFPRLSLKEKYDILSEEFLLNHSVNEIIRATSEQFKVDVNAQYPDGASKTRSIETEAEEKKFVTEKVCKLTIKEMDKWYKTEVLEHIEELKLYFNTVAIPDGATLSQVDLVSVVGPHVEQNVEHYFRGTVYNKYIRNKPIKEFLESKGFMFDVIKF